MAVPARCTRALVQFSCKPVPYARHALAYGLIADFKLSVTVYMHCRRSVIGNIKKFNMACLEAAALAKRLHKQLVSKRHSLVMAPRIKERTDKQASRPAAGFPNLFRAHIVYPQVSVLLCAVCNLRDKCSSCLLLCCRLQASPATASMCACHLCELGSSQLVPVPVSNILRPCLRQETRKPGSAAERGGAHCHMRCNTSATLLTASLL